MPTRSYDTYVGTVGYEILLTVLDKDTGEPFDLTTADVIKVIVKGSRGLRVERAATSPDPSAGQVRYLTVLGDVLAEGKTQAQAYVEMADGFRARSSILEFDVGPAL